MHGIYWKQEIHVSLWNFYFSYLYGFLCVSISWDISIHYISCCEILRHVWKLLVLYHSKLSKKWVYAAGWQSPCKNNHPSTLYPHSRNFSRPSWNQSLMGSYIDSVLSDLQPGSNLCSKEFPSFFPNYLQGWEFWSWYHRYL